MWLFYKVMDVENGWQKQYIAFGCKGILQFVNINNFVFGSEERKTYSSASNILYLYTLL